MRYQAKQKIFSWEVLNSSEASKEVLNISSHHENANANQPWDSTLHQSEWLRSKIQMTADAGKDAEKEECFSSVGGVVNWYNHSGNQSGNSSENWT